MNRRQYLTRAGASAGLLAGLAGCLDSGGSAETNEASAGSRAGERALDRAAGKLNKAAKALKELGSLEYPASVEFDPEPPRNRISTARDHLETAEAELSDDRQADIATLRSYADALAGLVAVTATVTDDSITEDIDTVNAAIESDGDVRTASEIVDERAAAITEARKRFDRAHETIRGLDGDRLRELAGVDVATLESGVAALGDAVTSLETLAGAYDATLDPDKGYGALKEGRKLSDKGEYEKAKTAFETAESTFADSRQRLESGSADAPEGLVDYFDTGQCQNRHLKAAAAAFADAAAAAADGDSLTAKRRKDEGESHLDDVGNCTS